MEFDLFGNPVGTYTTSFMEIGTNWLDKRQKDEKFRKLFDSKLNVQEEQKPRIENGKLIRTVTK